MKLRATVKHYPLYSEVNLYVGDKWVALTTCHRDNIRATAKRLKLRYLNQPMPKEEKDGG